jgi:hypothetical protein
MLLGGGRCYCGIRKEGERMDAQYVADRSLLRALLSQHPDWTNLTFAQATGRSLAWVKQWKARFRAEPDNPLVIWGKARAHPQPSRFPPHVIERILAIRDTPPESLQRTPGPKAILYYLPRSPGLHGLRLPRSTRTIWRILRTHDRILVTSPHQRQPVARPEPLTEIQLDFKDLVQVDPLTSEKHAHAVEVFDAVDVGTSLWLMGEPSAAYTADTIFAPLLHVLAEIGVPERVRCDRDPRFLGSTTMRDFPSPFVRFWYALGVQPLINPPRRPDLNAFVERLHLTVETEYRQPTRPTTLETVQQTLPLFRLHDHQERPHQGVTCGNRPPAIAHPTLPQRPRLPDQVDPDRWVESYHERCFARQVKRSGMVQLDGRTYYVGQLYAGTEVVAQVDATTAHVRFLAQQRVVRTSPLKGLVGQPMALSAFVTWCEHEARAMWRQQLMRHRLSHAG